jgi:hypothetical protein
VKHRFTFRSNNIDVLSLGGGAAAQGGSSGGSAVNESGKVIATITTSSNGPDIAARDLHAITINHIRRSFTADTGKNLDSYIADTSISNLVKDFSETASNLREVLTRVNF